MPEITISADKLPTVTVKFADYEEQKRYVQAEATYTARQLTDLYKAVTPAERKLAREAVYHTRVAFKNITENKPVEKDVA